MALQSLVVFEHTACLMLCRAWAIAKTAFTTNMILDSCSNLPSGENVSHNWCHAGCTESDFPRTLWTRGCVCCCKDWGLWSMLWIQDWIGRELNGKSSIRYILTPPHHTLLRPPTIAGHPDEGRVHALRCNQELSCVFTSGEEDYYFSVGFLQQRSDYSIVTVEVHGATDLGGRSDADLQGPGLLLKGVDARLAVITLWGNCGDVSPVKIAQDLSHSFSLIEVRGYSPAK